jgi:hypothetical protein
MELKYVVGVTSNDKTCVPIFVKIGQSVENLKEGFYTQTNTLVSLSLLRTENRVKRTPKIISIPNIVTKSGYSLDLSYSGTVRAVMAQSV